MVKAGPIVVTSKTAFTLSERYLACSREIKSLESGLKNVHQAGSQSGVRGGKEAKNVCAGNGARLLYARDLSDGVTVAQGPLEAFVMVRIHVGQPIFQQSRGPPFPHSFRTKMRCTWSKRETPEDRQASEGRGGDLRVGQRAPRSFKNSRRELDP